MKQPQSLQDLKLQDQGLQEAISLTAKYENLLQALVETPDNRDLLMEFEGLAPQTADLQTRFSPHLNTLSLLAGQLNVVQSKLDGKYRPTGGDLSAVRNTLANLESEYRVVSRKLEQLDRWVRADRDELILEISALAEALENVRNMFRFSNELAAKSIDGDIFRQTIISLLSATIEELKAPVVNVGRLQGIRQTVKRVMHKSVEKKLGGAIDAVLDQAANQADKVIDLAKDIPGLDNFL